MHNFTTDICIVGAGPSGLTAALFLAKQGIKSTIVEKATFPRDKICGDAFSGKVSWVLRRLDTDFNERIPKKSFQLPSWGVTFFGSKNNELKLPFKLNYNTKETAPGFIAKRIDFDEYLYQEAKKNPLVEIIEGIALNQFEYIDNGVKAASSDGSFTLTSKVLLAADGAYSKVAKDLMQFKVADEHNALGVRTYYKGVEGLDQDGFIELHFLKELLPGYFWIFPLPNGEANVGAGIRTDLMRKNRMNLKKMFHEIIQTHPEISKRFKNATLVDGIKTYGLPLGSMQRSISADRLILLGDAAALIDPFTGEGIGNGMISGMLAAEVVSANMLKGDFSADALKIYDEKVYKRLGPELKLSKRMQDLSLHPWLFNIVVNKARKNKELRETISCMFENVDIRKKLSNPLFYLKILFNY